MKKKHPYQRGYRKSTTLITGEEAGWCTGWGIDGLFGSGCEEITTSGLLYTNGQLNSITVKPLLDSEETENSEKEESSPNDLLRSQLQYLYDETKKPEMSTVDKIELSLAMARIYEAL